MLSELIYNHIHSVLWTRSTIIVAHACGSEKQNITKPCAAATALLSLHHQTNFHCLFASCGRNQIFCKIFERITTCSLLRLLVLRSLKANTATGDMQALQAECILFASRAPLIISWEV